MGLSIGELVSFWKKRISFLLQGMSCVLNFLNGNSAQSVPLIPRECVPVSPRQSVPGIPRQTVPPDLSDCSAVLRTVISFGNWYPKRTNLKLNYVKQKHRNE